MNCNTGHFMVSAQIPESLIAILLATPSKAYPNKARKQTSDTSGKQHGNLAKPTFPKLCHKSCLTVKSWPAMIPPFFTRFSHRWRSLTSQLLSVEAFLRRDSWSGACLLVNGLSQFAAWGFRVDTAYKTNPSFPAASSAFGTQGL